MNEWKLIVGLGNPGATYKHNRHNVGFVLIDELAMRWGFIWKSRGNYALAAGLYKSRPIMLVKPQDFMNASGPVVAQILKQKHLNTHELLVIHDELELPFGQFKLKNGGSHKGHNGVRSIIAACGADFDRIRFGIGRPEGTKAVSDYVLENFTADQQDCMPGLTEAVGALIESHFD